MAIITKPVEGILKGVPAIFTLNKSQVLALPLVSGDDYFSNSDNWERIILKYKSSEGKQQELVAFDTSLESPTGFFLISEKARGLFEIQSLKIVDFDGDVFVVPRSALNVADFDVVLLSAPSSLSYSTPVTYTQNTAITNNVPTVTGTVTSYSILPALPAGLNFNTTTGVISGTPTVSSATANYVVTASNGAGSTTAAINITVEAEIIDEFWDVANKSGVGTVSVGANRLITKTSGGGAYDVNVLSLETITGDGYIEFPNSSLLNIGNSGVAVLGLAEQTSTNGGFQNIILGAFTVTGNWERVLNGSISGVISAANPNDIVRIGRIGTEYYIKINDVIKTQVTINNTNPLKASISLFTTGTGVDNIIVESAEEFDIVNFTGRNSSTYISFPAPGSVTRLLPAVNLENNGQGSFWSTTPLSGDFTFTATVKAGSVSDGPVQALFGLNDVMPPPSNSGYGLKAAGWGLNFYNDGSVVRPWDVGVDTLAYTKGSTYNIEIKRVSGVVSYKVNSTTFSYTLSTSATVYLVGYLQVGSWEVTNAQLAAEEFTGGPIPWNNTSSGYLIELDGGVTTTAQRPSGPIFDIVYGSSNSYVTGDFIYEAEISTSLQSDSIIGFYDSVGGPYNTIVKGGATTLSFWLTNEWNNGTPEYTMAKPSGDTFLFKITRVGTLVKLFVNNVEIASETTTVSHLLVPFFTLRPNDYIVDAQITFAEVPVGDPIIWDTFLNGSTPQADGGISGGTSGAIVKSNASKAENGADFKFTFNFTRGPVNDSFDYLWGIMPSIDNTGFAGWTGVTLQSSNSILIYDNYSGSGPHSTTFSNSMLVLGPNTSEFEKIGNVLTIKMNGVIIYTKNNYTEQISVPMVRLWQGEQVLDSAYAEIQQTMAVDPILWQSKPGYIIEADGGATATSERPSYGEFYRVLAPSSQWVTGDFTFEAEINNAYSHNDFIGFYDSDTNFSITTGFSGSVIWYEQSTPTSYVKPTGDTYTVKMQRIGYVIKFYVNDVEVYSATQTNLSTVKVPFFTFTNSTKYIVSATLILPEANYYLYNQVAPVHTTNQFGAISSTGTGQSYNTNPITGNFDITFNFDAAVTGNDSIFGIKETLNFTDNYIGFRLYGGFHTYFNTFAREGVTQNSGANTYRITRTGSTIDFYANGVKLTQSANFSGTLYLVVRGLNTFNLISTVDNLGTGSDFVPVTWNVAGKTGVGTVTTGANGLITKTTGGNGYNVNVLSNETITGDGYVEFINSSIFLNVVFGLAEVNSSSGSYDQIIYGTYVAGLGAYERVLAGQASGGGIGASANGDVIRIQRTGTTFSIFKNGSVINTVTINNTNPLKASVSIYPGTSYGVNNVTLSE